MRGWATAGGACLLAALVGFVLSGQAMGARPELMEKGWALTLMFVATPMASIGGTLIAIGFFRRAMRRAAAADEPGGPTPS